MKKLSLLLALAGLPVLTASQSAWQCTLAQPDTNQTGRAKNPEQFDPLAAMPADQREIIQTIFNFSEAVESSDTAAAAALVANADAKAPSLKALAVEWKIARRYPGVALKAFPTITIEGDSAKAVCPLIMRDPLWRGVAGSETLQLRRDAADGGHWKIVAGNQQKVWHDDNAGYLFTNATALLSPDMALSQIYQWQTSFNLRSLFEGIQTFGTDEKSGLYAARSADMADYIAKQLAPSDPSPADIRRIATVPGGGTYTYNEKMNGLKAFADNPGIDERNLVAVYEGENQQPLFRFDGMALIIFADGNVRMVAEKDAGTLRFTP